MRFFCNVFCYNRQNSTEREIDMKTKKILMKDAIFTIIMLAFFYFSNLVIEEIFGTRNLIPMTFVLGVFLISIKTQGYFWGITASLASVLLVNYAFTYPYYAIDLITPECLGSAVVMLIVSVMTGTLTTQLKIQEKFYMSCLKRQK